MSSEADVGSPGMTSSNCANAAAAARRYTSADHVIRPIPLGLLNRPFTQTSAMGSYVRGCDTFVVLPPHTANGAVVFGKNSDRPSSEVQEVVYFPPRNNPHGATLKCSYVEIEDVPQTAAVILSKPAWMWGAEMGANEHGVVIGNEAVWTKCGTDLDVEKLLGMDLLRLGLERGSSAKEAVDVITTLLERHGQGGPCSDVIDMTYHNSFLIADRKEAWVLESADCHWAAAKVSDGFRNISNNLTITTDYTILSRDVKDFCRSKGWWDGASEFNFGRCLSSSGRPGDQPRQRDGKQLLQQACDGQFDARNMMSILRDVPSGICFERDGGLFVTSSSQVSVLPPASSEAPCVHFFTGTFDPSISAFKPFVFCGENSSASPLTKSPEFAPDKDPAKVNPRFGWKVDRRHELFRWHEKATSVGGAEGARVRTAVAAMEDETLDFLRSGRPLPHQQTLFADCVESELKIYKQ